MQWKIVLEGNDEFGLAHRSELTISKDFDRLSAGEIGFSVEDGKAIMAHLQQVVVKQQCEAYVLTSRFSDGLREFPADQGLRQAKVPTAFLHLGRKPPDHELPTLLASFVGRLEFLGDICRIRRRPN